MVGIQFGNRSLGLGRIRIAHNVFDASRLSRGWDASDAVGLATLKAANVDIITASPQFVAEMKKKIQPVEDEWIKEAKSRGWDGARFLGELRAEVKKLAAAK